MGLTPPAAVAAATPGLSPAVPAAFAVSGGEEMDAAQHAQHAALAQFSRQAQQAQLGAEGSPGPSPRAPAATPPGSNQGTPRGPTAAGESPHGAVAPPAFIDQNLRQAAMAAATAHNAQHAQQHLYALAHGLQARTGAPASSNGGYDSSEQTPSPFARAAFSPLASESPSRGSATGVYSPTPSPLASSTPMQPPPQPPLQQTQGQTSLEALNGQSPFAPLAGHDFTPQTSSEGVEGTPSPPPSAATGTPAWHLGAWALEGGPEEQKGWEEGLSMPRVQAAWEAPLLDAGFCNL